MNTTTKAKPMQYFEKVYLGKKESTISVKESKKLLKLLSAKALAHSAVDSRGLTTTDLKRMMPKKISKSNMATIDFESYVSPFETA